MLLVFLALFALAGVYFGLIKPLGYWKRRGVPYISGWGPLLNLITQRKGFVDYANEAYKAFPNERLNGGYQFTKPILIVRDIELIKKITVKDFDNFINHNNFVLEDVEPLFGKNLLSLKDQRWRDMRATLSPSFTGSKMRAMYSLLSECAEQFVDYFEKQGTETIELDMKDTFTRFTNDAIASVAFGLKCDSLADRNNEFYRMGKEATTFNKTTMLKFVIIMSVPWLGKILKLKFFSDKVSNFFRRIVTETIELRERENIVRPDMIQLLMDARNGIQQLREEHQHSNAVTHAGFAQAEDSPNQNARPLRAELTDDDITAQALLFFFGGFESSATLMCLTAHELAVNPDVQERLQEEVDQTFKKCNGKLSYDALMGMKYLDMVVSETLRMWPPGFQIDRVCSKDYVVPAEKPEEKDFVIEKDHVLIIPIMGIHRDARFYPNPDKFDPDRFSDENKNSIQPFTYYPFGSGPRNCIASRFALMESKIIIAYALSKFDFVPIKKTVIPLKIGNKAFNLMPNEGFWLGLRKRRNAA